MQDVQKLKKMNEMIPELKKHGFATFSDDASAMSQRISQESIPEVNNQAPVDGNPMERHFDVFKQQVDQRISSVEEAMKQVVEKMNEMIKTVNALEAKTQNYKPSNDVPRSEPQAPPQQEAPKERPKGAEPQKRSGDIQPGDIDVGDYFYFGNK